MLIRKLLILSLSMLTVSQFTFADESKFTKQFSICMDNSRGTTSEMLDCMGIETKYQDTRLNKAYKEVMVTLTAECKSQLQQVQRAWIKYRDTNCNFYADSNADSLATLNSANCFMEITASRVALLQIGI